MTGHNLLEIGGNLTNAGNGYVTIDNILIICEYIIYDVTDVNCTCPCVCIADAYTIDKKAPPLIIYVYTLRGITNH